MATITRAIEKEERKNTYSADPDNRRDDNIIRQNKERLQETKELLNGLLQSVQDYTYLLGKTARDEPD
jgi:hypothetical protein